MFSLHKPRSSKPYSNRGNIAYNSHYNRFGNNKSNFYNINLFKITDRLTYIYWTSYIVHIVVVYFPRLADIREINSPAVRAHKLTVGVTIEQLKRRSFFNREFHNPQCGTIIGILKQYCWIGLNRLCHTESNYLFIMKPRVPCQCQFTSKCKLLVVKCHYISFFCIITEIA